MKEEIWKDIKGYENLYQVSNLGRIKSIKKNMVMKSGINKGGYEKIILSYKQKRGYYVVHRLVAQAFLQNLKNKPQVNHIDGNKLNNNVNNLEWCTASENQKHAFRIGLSKQKKGSNSPFAKRIIQYDKNNNFIRNWNSIIEASNNLNINMSDITSCCKKRTHYNTAGGFIWKYDNKIDKIKIKNSLKD